MGTFIMLAGIIGLGSMIIFVIAAALVPLNIYLINRIVITGRSFHFTLLGIAGTVIAAAIYGINYYRTRDDALLAFTAATPLALPLF